MSKYVGFGCRIRGVWSLFYAASTGSLNRPLPTCSRLLTKSSPTPRKRTPLLETAAFHPKSSRCTRANPDPKSKCPRFTSLIGHGRPCLVVPWRLSAMYKVTRNPHPPSTTLRQSTLFLNALFWHCYLLSFILPLSLFLAHTYTHTHTHTHIHTHIRTY
jgi:hypothetical protein